MHAEAASESDCGGGVGEQRCFGGASDRLAKPFSQDQNARQRQAGAGEKWRDGQGRYANGSQAVAGEGERPVPPAAVCP